MTTIADELMLKRQHQAWATVNVCDGDTYTDPPLLKILLFI